MTDWTVLAAYPARIRRKHGAELIDTLLEMAGPTGRPTAEAKRMLMIDGLRERFRPPVRRPFALVAAILTLLIGGAFGAAAGSWLGALTYATLPEAIPLAQQVLPGEVTGSTYGHNLSAGSTVPAGTDTAAAAESARQKLAAEGWRTGPLLTGTAAGGVLDNTHFSAESEGVHLTVYAYPDANGVPYLSLAGWPQRTAAYVPLTVAGALLGLVAGWLTGVALTHRIREAGRPLPGAVLTAAGLALTIPSALGFVTSLVRYLTVTDPLGNGEVLHGDGFAFGPTIDTLRALDLGEGWLLSPGDLQQLWIFGFGLLAIAAIVARPSRHADREVMA
ncbi:hypothetical protein [Actinoplanes couchii]|uniref:Integral membrane protein n=1 Tax=Actinoplanes couchii TaxID=403638 RepID=A0ABQ3XK84_9ACTN|nr:hypothetical protein [Actinoplanes couchii]MDR6320501.1 hypothetical protein [Actinoplanes couchii]GID58906.1 hypothetical protein Aco03nite_073100 [Actinoplanes couchii]